MKAVAIAAVVASSISTQGAEYPVFSTRMGTQTFAPRYGFSATQTRLVETAEAINAMGSDVIKFGISANAFGSSGYNLPTNPADYPTLRAMAENEPSYRHVFDMPFKTYICWTYVRGINQSEYHNYWRDGLSAAEAQTEYNEIKELAEYLLTHYDGTGKTFLLGHWEGDWAIRGNYDANANPSATAVKGMIDWLTVRQQAVSDARAAHPTSDCKVLHYSEVNLVLAWEKGWTQPWQVTVHKDVIPQVAIDCVSYSAYEVCHILDPGLPFPQWMQDCLSAIESKTTFTAAAPYGRKVFIGEYGAATSGVATPYTAAQQSQLAAGTIKGAANWGAPFALYWEMYDNENKGFWLINSSNQKQPAYDKHSEFLGKVNTLKNLYRFWLGRNPTWAETNAFAPNFETYTVSGQLNTLLAAGGGGTNAQFLTLVFQDVLHTSNTSDPDYVSYLAQLNAAAKTRAQVLDEVLDSARFKTLVTDTDFGIMLYTGTLRRATIDTGSAEFQALLASLQTTPRATVWRGFLDSAEFLGVELLMRSDNQIGSTGVQAKFFFSVTPSRVVDAERLY